MADEPKVHRCVLSDLVEKELLTGFVKRYRRGSDLLVNGEVLHLKATRRVTIVATEQRMPSALAELNDKNESHRQELNRGSSGIFFVGGLGSGPDDIGDYGTDVTSKYINAPPGSEGSQSFFAKVIENPWVISIGATVVAAGITAWLKWN
jgi:hypothetical protein